MIKAKFKGLEICVIKRHFARGIMKYINDIELDRSGINSIENDKIG
jgi:hypothetical protein